MASKTTSDSPALPASPTSSENERHAELVWLDVSTIDEILNFIVSSRQIGTESIIGFHWQASQMDDLSGQLDARLLELDQPSIRRFEYDYESETVYLDIMKESPFHYQVQAGLRDHLKDCLAKLLVTTDNTEIRQLIQSAKEQGTASIEYEDKLCKQADVSFGQAGTLPSLVCERKARQYIDSSDGNIRAVLILDLQYPGMKKAWVSLLAADDSPSHWILHHELYHDDDLDQQPVGQVDLYLSDFVGLAGLSVDYCRPSTAELAAGITRNPTITLTFERLRAIFRRARFLHAATKFTAEVGDEEENPYEEVERRLAEERVEMERRVAEAERRVTEAEQRLVEERIKAERRVTEACTKDRAELERHMTAEVERRVAAQIALRVAGGRSEAE
ncbi:hypothetical protein N658DRAFT_518049 [Parathielavia hyrcaniae]|uniref:Uncharacterized protein n=1 Tax=Parathielavia hyrcaniae TaxID=113614 RepID=A0AAN6SZE2_9PEZI|nr:hypothetical protein N658DRAFT_518049 [Parathielavia hyrcaniae]